jgi:uncharacterized membrane protein required for colicin V production
MIDLTISGTLDKDVIVFTLNGESGHIDQFSKQIHFSVDETKTHRLYFEQKSEQYIPRSAEIILDILFLPIRGAFNVLTFNTVQTWEKDISAFKLSGYVDINPTETAAISFTLEQGRFEKETNMFCRPIISFFPEMPVDQNCSADVKEITKKHYNHVLNICSAAILLFGILFYLLFVGLNRGLYVACIITSTFIVSFAILTFCLILHSFRKRSYLISVLTAQ